MRLLPLLLALSTAMTASAAPGAAELSLEQLEQARELYASGAAAMREGRFAEAEAAFRRLYQIDRSPPVLLDIAGAVEKQGRWRDAIEASERYLLLAPHAKDRAAVMLKVAALRQRAVEEERAPRRRVQVAEGPRARWWIWAIVGGAAAASLAVGLGVGLGERASGPAPTSFPDIGPAASAALRF